MSLPALRNAIVETIRTEVPVFTSVEAHDGEWDLTEIHRHFGHHPRAARVVCPGIVSLEDIGGSLPIARARFVVFITCREQNVHDPDGKMTHGDACMLLAQRVLALVHGNRWGCEALGIPEAVRASNLYSGNLDKRGLSLWAVEWEQNLRIDDRLEQELDRLAVIHTDYELSEIHEGPDSSTTTVFPEPEEGP